MLDPDVVTAKFIGKPAPELRFKAADGKIVDLAALRGEPVFLEFWATVGAPCVEMMPELKKLYAETSNKGLSWITIDVDDEPAEAAQFLSEEHVSWPNYHDADGSLGKPFDRQGIPLGVLIDSAGNVVFYKAGYEISDLRAAIAKLGPEFSSIAQGQSVRASGLNKQVRNKHNRLLSTLNGTSMIPGIRGLSSALTLRRFQWQPFLSRKSIHAWSAISKSRARC